MLYFLLVNRIGWGSWGAGGGGGGAGDEKRKAKKEFLFVFKISAHVTFCPWSRRMLAT